VEGILDPTLPGRTENVRGFRGEEHKGAQLLAPKHLPQQGRQGWAGRRASLARWLSLSGLGGPGPAPQSSGKLWCWKWSQAHLTRSCRRPVRGG